MKNSRIFSKQEILESKAIKRGDSTTYPAPHEFLKGLMNIEEEIYNINLHCSHDNITVNEDETENISLHRVMIDYKFKIDTKTDYKLGLIVSMDKGIPVAKIYMGMQVHACLNMCIFGAEQILTFNLKDKFYSFVESFKSEFKNTQKRVKKAQAIKKGLENINFTHEKCKLLNGAILEKIIRDKTPAGIQAVINGIKLQSKKGDKYNSENGLTAWMYFNSLTEYLNEKVHPLDIPEKALDLFQCLKDEINFEIPEEEEKEIFLNAEILEVGPTKKNNRKKELVN